jgi:AraC-like DNA-binding protein
MGFNIDTRLSDSPFVEAVWRSQSVGGGSFTSLAENRWEMVVTKQQDKTTFTLRGPETQASQAPIPEDAEFVGIIFKLGAFMPHMPTVARVNNDIDLPATAFQSFWLLGMTWEIPNYDNADTFVSRLIQNGYIAFDPIIDAALQNQPLTLSPRSVERRFLQATGLTQGSIRQINRAKHALALLKSGVSILDTVDLAGYTDQPHLTRSLKRLLGQTPAQLLRKDP